jgi:protein gp37
VARTSIEWATHVWNPFTGCDRVSPGCAHCYAAQQAPRLKGYGNPRYQVDGDPRTSAPGFGFTVHWDKLERPERFPKGARVFVNSMSDVFHDEASESALAALWRAFAAQPDVNFLVLTKRPERMRAVLADRADFLGPIGQLLPLPLPNVWLGVSIENRRFVHRADLLRETPAAVRFISAEPLLGPLLSPESTYGPHPFADGHPSLDLYRIDWLIVGGESGPGARPMKLEWAHDLVRAAQATVTAPFVKQLGKVAGQAIPDGGRKGERIETWPEGLRVREFPAAPANAAERAA